MKVILVLAIWLAAPQVILASPLNDSTPSNIIENLNPFDPQIEETLREYDRIYEEETGQSPFVSSFGDLGNVTGFSSCYRSSCPVWIRVDKSSQSFTLYVSGSVRASGLISSGMAGYGTPNFDKNPNGRIYDAYSSSKFPGGDYNGLGNMPYAVFIQGGFALHGTPQGNWPRLGQRASHGCIRMHPDNAYIFNRLVRQYGTSRVWITVQ